MFTQCPWSIPCFLISFLLRYDMHMENDLRVSKCRKKIFNYLEQERDHGSGGLPVTQNRRALAEPTLPFTKLLL